MLYKRPRPKAQSTTQRFATTPTTGILIAQPALTELCCAAQWIMYPLGPCQAVYTPPLSDSSDDVISASPSLCVPVKPVWGCESLPPFNNAGKLVCVSSVRQPESQYYRGRYEYRKKRQLISMTGVNYHTAVASEHR